jgi:hypothetical protein
MSSTDFLFFMHAKYTKRKKKKKNLESFTKEKKMNETDHDVIYNKSIGFFYTQPEKKMRRCYYKCLIHNTKKKKLI